MTIRKKLLLNFSILISVIGLVLGMLFYLSNQVKSNYEILSNELEPALASIEKYSNLSRELNLLLSKGDRLFITSNVENLNRVKGILDVEIDHLNATIHQLQLHLPNDDLKLELNRSIVLQGEVVKNLSRKYINNDKFYKEKFDLPTDEVFDRSVYQELIKLDICISKLQGKYSGIFDELQSDLTKKLSDLSLIAIATVLLSLILFVFVFLSTLRSIEVPIQILQGEAKKISAGNFGEKIKIKGLKEFQELGNSFHEMSDSLKAYFNLIESNRQNIEENHQLEIEKKLAEKSLKLKSEFLANMSHEIRTPMNGIIGMIDVLEKTTELTEEQKNYLKTITDSSKSLMIILNDILDLSKLEAGKMNLITEPLNIQQILNQVKGLFVASAEKKGIKLNYEIASGMHLHYNGPKIRLLQVLSNLIGNALKFTESGSIDISVRVLSKATFSTLEFEVKDTGTGMKESDLNLLFQEFSQLDQSSTKKKEGTGLGLAISKRLVELMGGKIWVKSTVGIGSVFAFTVELECIAVAEEISRKVNTDANKFSGNVLLVDDKMVNLKTATLMIKHLGCEVDMAQSGAEAIEMALKNKYDLIFMDIQMPKMNGVEATQILKYEHYLSVPIIALTANAMEGDREKFIAQGLDDYVDKPITIDKIKKILNDWLN